MAHTGHGFIHQQHARSAGNGQADIQAPSRRVRQLRRQLVRHLLQPDPACHLQRGFPRQAVAGAGVEEAIAAMLAALYGHLQVFQHAQFIEDAGDLEGAHQPGRHPGLLGMTVHGLAEQVDLAGIGRQRAREQR